MSPVLAGVRTRSAPRLAGADNEMRAKTWAPKSTTTNPPRGANILATEARVLMAGADDEGTIPWSALTRSEGDKFLLLAL